MKYIAKKAIAVIVSLLAASGILAGNPQGGTNTNTGSQSTAAVTEQTLCDGNCTTQCEAPVYKPDPATTKPSTTKPPTMQPSTTKPATAQPSTTKPATAQPSTTKQNTDNLSFEEQVAALVNKERAAKGLAPLTPDAKLSNVARIKSQDMRDNHYFSHTSPTYGSPFEMMKSFGITYKTAGENIAMGYSNPEKVMQGWMNSSGHRANILNASFTRIGVGYAADGHYWTQQFIG